jgi:hypothetical protein
MTEAVHSGYVRNIANQLLNEQGDKLPLLAAFLAALSRVDCEPRDQCF